MRELTSHKGGLLNDGLRITTDGSGEVYFIVSIDHVDVDDGPEVDLMLEFHTGNHADGITGISNEALLAIVEDRLAGFQAGPFACAWNATALEHVRLALVCMLGRTKDRQARGVEGQATP